MRYMLLYRDIELIEGMPFAYIERINAIVCADLHLGYEYALATEQGIFLPGTQFTAIMDMIKTVIDKYVPDLFIINGDLKHVFGSRTWQEYREVKEILGYLNKNTKHTVLVRGNHDNFVRGMFSKYENVDFVEPYFEVNNFIFTHGHIFNLEILEKIKEKDILIMGHEHPAILLSDDVGGRLKLPVFLFGSTRYNTQVLVLPAVSPLMMGIEVNRILHEELLSPLLKAITQLYDLTPYAIESNKKIWEFPVLRKWHSQYTDV